MSVAFVFFPQAHGTEALATQALRGKFWFSSLPLAARTAVEGRSLVLNSVSFSSHPSRPSAFSAVLFSVERRCPRSRSSISLRESKLDVKEEGRRRRRGRTRRERKKPVSLWSEEGGLFSCMRSFFKRGLPLRVTAVLLTATASDESFLCDRRAGTLCAFCPPPPPPR